ncbi:unnamed protein product [Prunus armeniaca]|uniref:Transmembrane protein n=1 Tax=Prunus armeniaca TaxID=36596 RepID=A0A6J5VX20_PRUAR|nr:unnamed protein product [Prunus armeniaca]
MAVVTTVALTVTVEVVIWGWGGCDGVVALGWWCVWVVVTIVVAVVVVVRMAK